MSDKHEPWAYLAHRDGVWCAVISAQICDNPRPDQVAEWKKAVAKETGSWVADGWEVMTLYSREEYTAAIGSMKMFTSEGSAQAQESML